MSKSYSSPTVKDYGSLQQLTAVNQQANLSDVPIGSPLSPGEVRPGPNGPVAVLS